jgi:hypothetical protein
MAMKNKANVDRAVRDAIRAVDKAHAQLGDYPELLENPRYDAVWRALVQSRKVLHEVRGTVGAEPREYA